MSLGRCLKSEGHPNKRQGGFTMVELLVAMVSGMALVLAVTVMMTRFESGRRTLGSLNATESGAAFASYVLDRQVRSAGSGFMRGGPETLGCALRVSRSGSTVLPRATAFPAPFAAVPTTVRLVPLVAFAGAGLNGSDLLMLAAGAGGLGEVPLRVLPGSVANDQLRVPATVGLRAGDLLLLSQDGRDCMVQQLANGFVGGADQLVLLGGDYAAAAIGGQQLTDMGVNQSAYATQLGNIDGNRPSFRLIGLGPNNSLVSHDLLRLDGSDTVQPEADGVVDLRVRYGVDSDGDASVDTWVAPSEPDWTAAALLDGSGNAQAQLSRILAVQVAMVVRDPTAQRDVVSPAKLTLFGALPQALQVDHAVSGSNLNHRHRVIEFTVPLRNAML